MELMALEPSCQVRVSLEPADAAAVKDCLIHGVVTIVHPSDPDKDIQYRMYMEFVCT